MSKLILVSNRLPVTVQRNAAGFAFQNSIGGLATGLKNYHQQAGSVWVGWLGITDEDMPSGEKDHVQKRLQEEYQCRPVFLSDQDISLYYHGFCNKTIWPLFHYFKNKTEYDHEAWEAYQSVNRKFLESMEPIIEENDIIWVHDYHLMLLPQMIKEKYPQSQVGFFLHIPFPSFEIFRLLIWREEILSGLLGADLIGFHTYDYVRHFLSSVRRLLGSDHNFNKISYEDRYVQVDAFPMGIDYDYFARECDPEKFQQETGDIIENVKGSKIILSVDRLDYSKGIPERIKAYRKFLLKYPQYREKIKLYLLVAPSREGVGSYDELLKEIEELVSKINGEFGTFSWMPIWFFFRSFSQNSLIYFYKRADVLLVTPLRDGMNLVAKEYIASRTDYKGMLVISETAGAASELGEAVIVNANDYDAIASGIKAALEMPGDEARTRNKKMHQRLKRYNVNFWASEFLNALNHVMEDNGQSVSENIEKDFYKIEQAYQSAGNRVLFLDYDGTLVGFKTIPEQAGPDQELKLLLADLANDPQNTVVIVSGRDKNIMEEWLGDLNLNLLASHGLWIRRCDQKEWTMTVSLDNEWKDSVRHILELYTDRMPGSFIEEKEYSLAWHYRQCDPDMSAIKLSEMKEALLSLTQSTTLGLQEGNKVLEIKDGRVNKGYVSSLFIQHNNFDFILGAGDDYTDEDLFASLPPDSFAIKVGIGNTNANYHIKSWQSMRGILKKLAAISNKGKDE
ncbi:MAG TPA: bifunctional alpha,alpha-trehalose-phosphate synthase (UDP-forming)/trehalose-phosphatase [Syntrophomonas sp.]|jgi:trehalose 6-phosphate synthase/phosphatase|nr:bifunctional alpha,alpha-trehalose-phosphate synthase (UDP-forming)/trehalose-phosphatase [Syntrophomonas sp.]